MVKKTAKKKPVKATSSPKKSQDKKQQAQKTETKSTQNQKKPEKTSSFNFDKKLLLKVLPFLFLIFVMWFAFHVRSGPINLDGMDERIEANIYSNIKSAISQQVDTQYPNLDPVYKQDEVNKRYDEVLNTGVWQIQGQTINIDEYVKKNLQSVKDAFKDENGQTYLNAIDPYHFYKLAYNYEQNGHTGDTLKNGEPWISYKLAPNGKSGSYKPNFHIWLESFLYKQNNIDENSTVGEKTASIYLIPVIFAMLSAIPIYFILRRFTNDLFALGGSLLLVSIGTYVSRTIAGFVDTDAYNIFFPLVISAFLIYGFVFKNKLITILFGFLAGLFLGLFIWAWSPGWFIFIFSLASLIGYFGYLIINNLITKDKYLIKEITNDSILLFSFIISSLIFTFIFAGRNIFSLAYNGLVGSVSSIAGIGSNIWPNVLSSVAELNPASFGQIINSVGGKVIFLIAMLGLVFLTIDFKTKDKKNILQKRILIIIAISWISTFIFGNLFVSLTANNSKLFLILLFLPVGIGFILSLFNANKSDKLFLAMLLGIWMAGTIYMSLNGVRFILLLAPAFAIAFGLGLYYIANIINEFMTIEFSIKKEYLKKVYGYIAVTLLFIILFIPMANQAKAISDQTLPNFDDAWYSTMYKIENQSQKDAIITSWWDFGHFFAAISNRGVTFDGGSQTTPQAHWVGKLLMENDEDKAVDILRMLVCGGNNAHEYMLEMVNGTTADAVKINKIIYSTFGKDIGTTKQIIEDNPYYKFNNEQVNMIMDNLACENPSEDFLITSEDMVGKAGVWAHWGSWDFTKKYTLDNYKKKTPSEIAYDIDENQTLIQQYVDELIQIDIKAETENIKRENLINQWLAPYPSYIPIGNKYEYSCQQTTNITLECQNSIAINMQTGKVTSSLGDQITFANLIIPNNDGTLKIVPQEGKGNVDVLLIPTMQGFNSMIMQTPLGASTFTKLFYLNGFGTKHFELFDNVQSMTGNKVKTWKVKWDIENELSNIDKTNTDTSITSNTTMRANSNSNTSSIGVGSVEFDVVENSTNSTN